jgi:predicted nucleotidyltransferase
MSPGASESKPTPAASGDADREIESIKRRLREALPRLRETYAVEQPLHGSRLRGEAGPDSDLDVLVDFQDAEAGRAVTSLISSP